jgi:hypothetical protein
MTPKIVLPDGDPHMAALLSRPDFAARLDRLGGARLHADLPKNDDDLIARIGDATVVILGAYLTGPVLRRLPALEFISFTGTGAATFVDLSAARDCGIAVANVVHYGDAAVAEHALALTLALAKNVVGNDRAVRAGEWHVGQGVELAGKTAGIVGYGGIGARLADLLEAIGMRVVAWTLHRDPARLTSPTRDRAARRGLPSARPAECDPLPPPGLQHPGKPGAHARRGRRQRRALPIGHPRQHCRRPRPQFVVNSQSFAIGKYVI